MSNPETKSQYEGAILNQLVQTVEKVTVVDITVKQNGQRLTALGNDIVQIKQELSELKQEVSALRQEVNELKKLARTAINLLITIIIGIVINIFSQPVLSFMFN